MKITNPAQIRNFVVAGHNGSGKTTLCDLMLYKAGAVDRLGSVDAKTSVSDFTPDEQDKRSSIYASFMHCDWKDHKLFLTDTPGYGGATAPHNTAAAARRRWRKVRSGRNVFRRGI